LIGVSIEGELGIECSCFYFIFHDNFTPLSMIIYSSQHDNFTAYDAYSDDGDSATSLVSLLFDSGLS
jgi:hypothetical protein